MKQSNTVLRLLPASLHHVSALEQWFGDMAKQGLFFSDSTTYGIFFQRGTAKDCIYRLEPIIDRSVEIPFAQNESYKEFGWKYGGVLKNQYYVYFNEDAHPIELHTDPYAMAIPFERLCNFKKRLILFYSAVAILLLAFSLWRFIHRFHSIVFHDTFSLDIFCTLLFGFAFFQEVWQYRCITKLKTQLQAGIPMPHHGDYQNLWIKPWGLLCLYAALILSTFGIPAYDIYVLSQPVETISLQEISTPLPYLPLTEIEDGDHFFIDFDEIYASQGSLLAPQQYILSQSGKDFSRPLSEETDFYNAHLSINYYQVVSPALVPPTVKSLGKFTHGTPLESDLFDQAYYRKTDYFSEFLLGKNDIILEITYYGDKDFSLYLEDFLPLFDENYDFSQVPR